MNDRNKPTLWLGAFRYYLGRMSYAVSDFCDLLIREWPNLDEHTKSLIRKELEEAVKLDALERSDCGRSLHARLGMDCDRDDWVRVLDAIREVKP